MAAPSNTKIEKAKIGSLLCEVAMSSNVGLQRSENQDSFAFAQTSHAALFVVADGMGGARGGGTASAMAVNLISSQAFDSTGQIVEEQILKAINLSNQVIFTRSKIEPHLHGMGTTVVAIAIVQDKMLVAHVGDSRAYLFRAGKLYQLTKDHTLVQELIDNGAIDPENAESYPISHMLTRSLGPLEEVKVDVTVYPYPEAGDKFLLCSDGLYNHLKENEIEEILLTSSGKLALIELEQAALDDGGTDNLTMHLIEFKDAQIPEDQKKNLNGSVDRYIYSEIDVSKIQGKPFSSYVDSVLSGEILKSLPKEESENVTKLDEASMSKEQDTLAEVFGDEVATKRNYTQVVLAVVFFLVVATVSAIWKKQSGESKKIEVVNNITTTTLVNKESSTDAVAAKEEIITENTSNEVSAVKTTEFENIAKLKEELPSTEDEYFEEEFVLDEDSKKLITEETALASDYFIATSPSISVGGGSLSDALPDQKINWKQEKNLLKVITSSEQEKIEAQKESIPQLRTLEENKELANKKQELRDKISDIDLKISILFYENTKQAQFKSVGLAKSVENSEKALVLLEDELKREQEKQKSWMYFSTKLEQEPLLKLADSIYHLSPEVRQKRKAYSELTENYLSAVEAWQNNPKDSRASSMMNLMSKEIKSRKLELENEVTAAVQRGIVTSLENIKSIKFKISLIAIRKDRISRQVGFLKAFIATSKSKIREYQNKLLKDRKGLLEELKNIRDGFSDEDELAFRSANV